MRMLCATTFCVSATLVLSGCAVFDTGEPEKRVISVDVYKGGFATVNSFVFSNGQSLLVLDVQRKPDEARKLVDLVKSKNLPLKYILISHGHTDHFTGMGVFREAFPDAEIVVANEDIKRDIKAYAAYMDSGGETGAEPALDRSIKPKSPEFPEGFDYEANIKALNSDKITLPGGGTLELTTDYKPTEADHMTTVYSPDLNALFLADLGYNEVHNWMGDDISWADVANWREELLKLETHYTEKAPAIYPGHGDVADMRLFGQMIRYIDDYKHVVESSSTRAEAMQQMVSLYPNYAEADFFLKYSLENHMHDQH